MDTEVKSKFNLILSNVTANQSRSEFENLHTIISYRLCSNFKGSIVTPLFRLCGSEQLCHIKMDFHADSASILLLYRFEETLYQVKPVITSIIMIKDGEIEKLSLIGSNILWSSIKHQKYFNSEDFFEIQFTIHYIPNTPTVSSLFKPKKSVLYDCLLNMYMEKKCTDVELIVENKKFSAHKSILARSPVFEAMFQHEMREKYQQVVTINGIESQIFDIILKFLYIGEINDINEINTFDNKDPTQWKLANILKAADMYQIEDMKVVLGYIAKKFLNVDNVAYYFAIATEYNTWNLKYSSLSLIRDSGSQICHNKKFKDTITANPTIALELVKCLLDK